MQKTISNSGFWISRIKRVSNRQFESYLLRILDNLEGGPDIV